MRKAYLLLPVTLAILLGAFYITTKPDTKAAPTVKPAAVKTEPVATNATLLAAVNAERAKYGAAPLTEDPKLDQSAQAKACDEYDNHYHGHIDKAGIHGWQQAKDKMGLEGWYGENLVWGSTVSTPDAMEWWLGSKPHHDAMIDTRYTVTGFGVCGNGADITEQFYGPY